MRLFELQFLTKPDMGPNRLTEAARRAASAVGRDDVTPTGAMMGALPGRGHNMSALVVVYDGHEEDPNFDDIYGWLARQYGVQPTWVQEVPGETLTFKSDQQKIQDYKEMVRRDDFGNVPDDDEEEFVIIDPPDEADE